MADIPSTVVHRCADDDAVEPVKRGPGRPRKPRALAAKDLPASLMAPRDVAPVKARPKVIVRTRTKVVERLIVIGEDWRVTVADGRVEVVA
jgi:hypothetical protein